MTVPPITPDWLDGLGLAAAEVPRLLILEGTWWEERARAARLPLLDDVRALDLPGLWWGRVRGEPVAYACAYGAPRAVEPVHIFGELGTPTVLQIGSCGGLQLDVRTGDVVVPERATIGEGASQYYGGREVAVADAGLVDAAARALEARGVTVHRGAHVTTSALLAQPPALVRGWSDAGHLAVDMETSAVFSAAGRFGMRAAALLFVWDELLRGRGFLAAFSDAEEAAQRRANAATFEVALAIGMM